MYLELIRKSRDDMYVDDLVPGGESLQEVEKIRSDNNINSLFILGNNVRLNQHKITKLKLLHINRYIKPSYLGMDQYRVRFHRTG